jgi:hypothetical protein
MMDIKKSLLFNLIRVSIVLFLLVFLSSIFVIADNDSNLDEYVDFIYEIDDFIDVNNSNNTSEVDSHISSDNYDMDIKKVDLSETNQDKIDLNILNEVDKGKDQIKVIVKLRDQEEQEIENGLVSSNSVGINSVNTKSVDVNSQIINERENIISSLEIEEKVTHQFIYSNAFSAELTVEEIEQLINDDRVDYVYYDYPVSAFLQQSVPLINATSTWGLQVNNINLTGAGQAVCVIDTGVDYTHPDLGGCLGEGCKVLGGYDFVNDNADPMDDHYTSSSSHSHGTHVAGIVAANGGRMGVASEANIIAIKALNYEGSGYLTHISAGMDWCINHSEDYNISVISMSLGGDPIYTTYCNNDLLAGKVTDAFNKNISVVIATGNSGLPNNISAPSCIQKAIRIGSTDKSDVLSSFSNRWGLDLLFAPGSSISSTLWLNAGRGDYGFKSGTSMATPHAAGAIAIINQYLTLRNKTMTPQQIQNVLFDTGTVFSADGRDYSRIDVYSAILTLELLFSTFKFEKNTSIVEFGMEAINISWIAEFEVNIVNVVFNITYPNGTLLFQSNNNTGYVILSYEDLTDIGIYNLSLWASDILDNENQIFDSFNVVDTTPPEINITSPISTYYNYSKILINISVYDNYLLDSIWYNWNGTNTSYENEINITFNEGLNQLFVWANDTNSNLNFVNISFIVDTIPPNITIISPINTSNYNKHKVLLHIIVNDDLSNIDSIWYNWNGTNKTYLAPHEIVLSDDMINLTVWVNDSVGNINSKKISFFVSAPPFHNFIKTQLPYIYDVNNVYWFNLSLFDPSGVQSAKLYLWNQTTNSYSEFLLNNNVDEWYYSINNLTNGTYNYYFWASDNLGNSANITSISSFSVLSNLSESQKELDDNNYVVPLNKTELIVSSVDILNNIIIFENITSNVNLNFINRPNNEITFTSNITINRTINQKNLSIEISENTTMDVNGLWDGSFILPQLEDLKFSQKDVSLAVKLGFDNEITFNKPVKIILPGQANKSVGWTRQNSALVSINTVCNNLINPSNINKFVDPKICRINSVDGNDLIIWTYHFTTFVAYEDVSLPPSSNNLNNNPGGGGGGSSLSSICVSNWVCTPWSQCINGFETRTCEDVNKCIPSTIPKPEERERCFSLPNLPTVQSTENVNNLGQNDKSDLNQVDEEGPDSILLNEYNSKRKNIFYSFILISISFFVILIVIREWYLKTRERDYF